MPVCKLLWQGLTAQRSCYASSLVAGCAENTPGAALVAGRFAFVELRTEELATTSMTLDKTELLGRPMNIGRPKGYVPGSSAPGEDAFKQICLTTGHQQLANLKQQLLFLQRSGTV